MSEIRYIDIAEFLREGLLQEANRQFFHPLGLALEITTVDEDGWTQDSPRVKDLAAKLKTVGGVRESQVPGDLSDEEYVHLAQQILYIQHPTGSAHISGVWDYRNDPEGMVFAEKLDPEKAKRVRALRAAHFTVRCDLFGIDERYRTWLQDPDHQPLDWAPSVGPPRSPYESETR